MVLANLTWPEVDQLDRDRVVILIPTGSLEQHGPHLPLFTDSLLATAAAQELAQNSPEITLLTPCLWMGASLHHMPFAGTITATFDGYNQALQQTVTCLIQHRFTKFMTINGHGGNCDSNSIALRDLKARYPQLQFAATNYFDFIPAAVLAEHMQGPIKHIQHACEAEVALMLHKFPDLVRVDQLRNDGLAPQPAIPGLISQFDEITEQGSLGYATYATAELGKNLWDAMLAGGTEAIKNFSDGITYVGIG